MDYDREVANYPLRFDHQSVTKLRRRCRHEAQGKISRSATHRPDAADIVPCVVPYRLTRRPFKLLIIIDKKLPHQEDWPCHCTMTGQRVDSIAPNWGKACSDLSTWWLQAGNVCVTKARFRRRPRRPRASGFHYRRRSRARRPRCESRRKDAAIRHRPIGRDARPVCRGDSQAAYLLRTGRVRQ